MAWPEACIIKRLKDAHFKVFKSVVLAGFSIIVLSLAFNSKSSDFSFSVCNIGKCFFLGCFLESPLERPLNSLKF